VSLIFGLRKGLGSLRYRQREVPSANNAYFLNLAMAGMRARPRLSVPDRAGPGPEEAVSHNFTSISVRLKVILAFAAVLTCTIGLGLFSIQRLEALNANAQEIRDNYLPSTGSSVT
jgi:hypothetical protein